MTQEYRDGPVTDLAALTEDALVALTNRGLYKRALGLADQVRLEVTADGTLRATMPDGNTTQLSPDEALGQAQCSCGADGLCRHVLATVLAYQRADNKVTASADPGEAVSADATVWSPGEFTDETLRSAFGAQTMTSARRLMTRGLSGTVHRGAAPSVDLPTATVRFLVPHILEFALSEGHDPTLVVLAVWLCRQADQTDPAGDHVSVDLSGSWTVEWPRVLRLLNELVADGIANTDAAFPFALGRRELAGLPWPQGAWDELADQVAAHAARRATHDPERTARLVAELMARHATANGGRQPLNPILGLQVPSRTQCDHLRLRGLGARVRVWSGADSDEWQWVAEVYLVDPISGVVMVVRHKWRGPLAQGTSGRRVGGVGLDRLATGEIVTESAYRLANRELKLGRNRIAPTAVMAAPDIWPELPAPVLVTDFAAGVADLAARPPSLLAPRVMADNLRLLRAVEIHHIRYQAGAQRMTATLLDAAGQPALAEYDYNQAAPGGIEALSDALAGPGWVAGEVHRRGGMLRIRPTAVLDDTGHFTVPDLVTTGEPIPLQPSSPSGDALDRALAKARADLAAALHHGVHGPVDLDDSADALAALGLSETAHAVRTVRDVPTWVAAELRVLFAEELR